MRAIVASNQADPGHPFIDKPGVLAGAKMPAMVNPLQERQCLRTVEHGKTKYGFTPNSQDFIGSCQCKCLSKLGTIKFKLWSRSRNGRNWSVVREMIRLRICFIDSVFGN